MIIGIHMCITNLALIFCVFNPLIPNNDQHQFSPNKSHTLSREMDIRIKFILITKEKMI